MNFTIIRYFEDTWRYIRMKVWLENGINVSADNIITKSGHNKLDNAKNSGKQGGSSFFAGEINGQNTTDSIIEQKRKLAGKQAMKLVKDAWERDNGKSESMQSMNDNREKLLGEMRENNEKIKDIAKQKQICKESYGITDDSEEQKDLELLEKYQNNILGVFSDDFSKEEIDRLKELQSKPRTEYQKKMLELNGLENNYRMDNETKKMQIQSITATENQAKIDNLKNQDMLDASDAADDILAALSKEMLGLLVSDAKDKSDEKAEEDSKKKEEIEEKQEEKNERLEEAKEKRKEEEKIIKDSIESDKIDTDVKNSSIKNDRSEEVQKIISKVTKDNKLVNEELKGIEIDLGI